MERSGRLALVNQARNTPGSGESPPPTYLFCYPSGIAEEWWVEIFHAFPSHA